MPIYDKSTRFLMQEFAQKTLRPDQVFLREDAVRWFAEHYPKTKPTTVRLHVSGMSVNNGTQRKHNPHIKPNAGWDLFFKLGPSKYRLYDPANDPPPYYAEVGTDLAAVEDTVDEDDEAGTDTEGLGVSREFALESHLRDYLAHNLFAIEPGLKLFEEETLRGVEYPVGGRYIDILATDTNGAFVVIELKVSRGYDRTIGQILRYMGWVHQNIANGKAVRGVIVASEITEDLKLAASRLQDVKLVEYELEFRLKPV
jgi:hypothetical protein